MIESFTVCAGKGEEFVIIKGVATRSSRFFQAAMAGDWKEARENRVLLPDTEPRIFEGYLQWLYTSTLSSSGPSEYHDMVEFYILGDFLDDLKFRNAALDRIMSRSLEIHNPPGPSAIGLAWEKMLPGSSLRQVITELWLTTHYSYAVTWLLEPALEPAVERPQYPKEFVLEHFRKSFSSHALQRKTCSGKSREQVVADFKLRMSETETGGVNT